MTTRRQPEISVVIPAYNEEANIAALVHALLEVLGETGKPFEVVIIDDGSTDQTYARIQELTQENPIIRGVRMRKNFGKSTALAVGFDMAQGDVVITLDADYQDDPVEIPRFLEQIEAGYDLVSGWKKIRKDPSSRVHASHLFNAAIRWVTGVNLHDFNCGFKAYRKEVVKSIPLYGEWHRFIPVLAADLGFKVTEVAVCHRPRTHGKSRYGLERYFRGFADCVSVLLLSRYSERPGHLFMGTGIVLLAIGVFLSLAEAAFPALPSMEYLRLLDALPEVGFQFFVVGLLAELITSRIGERKYQHAIREQTSFEKNGRD